MKDQKRWRIENKDCMQLLKTIPDQEIDLVAIDPPYGIDVLNEKWDEDKINRRKEAAAKSTVGSIPVGMKFSPETSKRLGRFLYTVSEELIRVLKPGGFCLVFSQARSSHRVGVALEDAGFELRDQLIWDYGAGQGKAQGMQNFIKKTKEIPEEEKSSIIAQLHGYKTPQLTPTFETIWLAQKPKEGKFWQNFLKYNVGLVDFRDGNKKVCFSHRKPNKQEREMAGKHPTLKPKSLMVDLVKTFSTEDSLVLDCFCGSGTTAVAALEQGRRFLGGDLSEHWCRVASQRLSRFD